MSQFQRFPPTPPAPPLPDACFASRDAVMRKVELCESVLSEARRLLDGSNRGILLAQLLGRARDLVDEVDEVLLALDHSRERAVFERMTSLREALDAMQSRAGLGPFPARDQEG